jgi:hypothetical protein
VVRFFVNKKLARAFEPEADDRVQSVVLAASRGHSKTVEALLESYPHGKRPGAVSSAGDEERLRAYVDLVCMCVCCVPCAVCVCMPAWSLTGPMAQRRRETLRLALICAASGGHVETVRVLVDKVDYNWQLIFDVMEKGTHARTHTRTRPCTHARTV